MAKTGTGAPLTYAASGVDIDAQDRALAKVKDLAKATFTPGVLSEIGSFGGLYSLEPESSAGIVLVASADGVGTKLKVAQMAGVHDTVGEDLVNHCVNDILVQGARPLFFLDYLAAGTLDPEVVVQVVSGLAVGCTRNGCALLGGETAEMPGFYKPGEYDVAGFIVGSVQRDRMLTSQHVRENDVLVALPSSGLHTNGYSLARKVFFEILGFGADDLIPELGRTVASELLTVHRTYLAAVSPLIVDGLVKSAAHITGGGITDNLPRALPVGFGAEIDLRSWDVPPVFQLIREVGKVPENDMRRTFNLGVGMILVIAESSVGAVLPRLVAHGPAWVIGRVTGVPEIRFLEGVG